MKNLRSDHFKRILLKWGIFLVSLEIFLRLGGFTALSIQDYQNRLNLKSKGQYRILCLGESITFEGGQDSYPSQLEQILNSKTKDVEFKVINKGIVGTNTTLILENLPQWLKEYEPDCVVAMMGINDAFDLKAYHVETRFQKGLRFLKNIRVYKLGRGLKEQLFEYLFPAWKKEENATAQLSPAEPVVPGAVNGDDLFYEELKKAPRMYRQLYQYAVLFETKNDHAKAAALYRRLIDAGLNNILTDKIYRNFAYSLVKQERYPELINLIEEMLNFNPDHMWVRQWVWDLCRKPELAAAIQTLLEKKIEAAPNSFPFYHLLGACYMESGDKVQGQKYMETADRLNRAYFNPATQTNYRKFLDILQEKTIKTVFMQYPLRSPDLIRLMLDPKQEGEDYFVVDNDQPFKDILRTGHYEDYFKDRIAGDFGHGTVLGNKMLAENLAEVIMKRVIKWSQ